MDQHFNEDVMQDLMAGSPSASADDAYEQEMFEDESFNDDFEGEHMEDDFIADAGDEYDEAQDEFSDETEEFEDGFAEDFGDEFAEEAIDAVDVMDAMEEAVADTLDAEDSDEFLRRLIGGMRSVAGAVRRGAGTVRRVAGTAQRVAGQVGQVARGIQGIAGTFAGNERPPTQRRSRRRARPQRASRAGNPLAGLLQQLIPILQQYAAQGADEMEVFEDLADWFEQEEADAALPVLAGVAARSALRPLVRRGNAIPSRAVNRQLLRGTVQGARNLIARQGPQAVRALRPIARSVGRIAVRRGLRPAALPSAMRQTAARVAAQPSLVRRLSQPSAQPVERSGTARGRMGRPRGAPRRFVVNGPVEIIVRR